MSAAQFYPWPPKSNPLFVSTPPGLQSFLARPQFFPYAPANPSFRPPAFSPAFLTHSRRRHRKMLQGTSQIVSDVLLGSIEAEREKFLSTVLFQKSVSV